jgi:hypothetical protein
VKEIRFYLCLSVRDFSHLFLGERIDGIIKLWNNAILFSNTFVASWRQWKLIVLSLLLAAFTGVEFKSIGTISTGDAITLFPICREWL